MRDNFVKKPFERLLKYCENQQSCYLGIYEIIFTWYIFSIIN